MWKRSARHDVVAAAAGYADHDIICWFSKISSWTMKQLACSQGLDTLDRRLAASFVKATLDFKVLKIHIMNSRQHLGVLKG